MNFAARMETTGQPGRLQVTSSVATRLANHPALRVTESSLKLVKGKGEVLVGDKTGDSYYASLELERP